MGNVRKEGHSLKLKWIRNSLLLLLLTYFLYCIIGGIASYIWPKKADFPVDVTEFYGDVAGADSAALVETPEEAFARRIELIRSAKETLDISYHCVKEGESVDCMFAEVLKATRSPDDGYGGYISLWQKREKGHRERMHRKKYLR